jgi:hypothetical protein
LGPFAQVNQLTPLSAKWPIGIAFVFDFFLAGGTLDKHGPL